MKLIRTDYLEYKVIFEDKTYYLYLDDSKNWGLWDIKHKPGTGVKHLIGYSTGKWLSYKKLYNYINSCIKLGII